MGNLVNVTLSKTVSRVHSISTRFCYAFSNWILSPENEYLELDDYGCLYYKGKNVLIRLPPNAKNIQIPNTVTRIEEQAFQLCQKIATLTIPKSVTSIGGGFVYDTRFRLVQFEIGSPITVIESPLFQYNGIYSVFFTKSITRIAPNAFDHSSVAIIMFEDNSELRTIQYGAFRYSGVTNFTFPPNVVEIGANLFFKCTKLTTIHIPASLINIDPQAFNGCDSIKTITIDSNNPNYTVLPPATLMTKDTSSILYLSPTETQITIPATMSTVPLTLLQTSPVLINVSVEPGSQSFYAQDGILYNFQKTAAIACCGGISEVKLIKTCTSIGQCCFYGLKKLTSVIIPDDLTSIGDYAFYMVKGIETIIFPMSLKSVGSYGFAESSIKNAIFQGDNMTYIGNYCFAGSNIVAINFSKNIKTINSYTFQSSKLSVINIDRNSVLQTINYYSFRNTPLTEITIPRSVTTIDEASFLQCRQLTTIHFVENCELTTIRTSAFRYCPIESLTIPKSVKTIELTAFASNNAITTLSFEPGTKIESIGAGAWRECSKLAYVSLPDSITSFDPSVFQNCQSLLEINFDANNKNYSSTDGIVYTISGEKLVCCPSGRSSANIRSDITIIGSNAFYQCTKLSVLTFADGCQLEYIEEGTFFSCTALTRIDLPTSLKTVMRNAFAGCTNLEIITFPNNSLCNLNAESIFSDCVALKSLTFGKFCALTIFGPQTFKGCSLLETITIPANCTTIGNNCFENCVKLSSINYESGSHLKTIGAGAFIGCTSLTDYNVPDVFDSITSMIFGDAPSIINVHISPNRRILSIGSNAFASFPLQTIEFGAGTTVNVIQDSAFLNKPIRSFIMNSPLTIGNNAFKGCSSLSSIQINQASSVGDNSFNGCSSLTSINLNSVNSIGNNAFQGCSSLNSVSINSVTTIGSYAFSGCNSLQAIMIPQVLSSISPHCFEDCTRLSNVNFNGNSQISAIDEYSFSNCQNIQSISIPKSVLRIGSLAFKNCIKLSTVQYAKNTLLKTINDNAFNGCILLNDYRIPDSFVLLNSSAFGSAPNILTVTIPSGMSISIQANTFSKITMKSLVFEDGSLIESLNDYAFNSSTINSIDVIMNSLSGRFAFKNCIKLTNVNIVKNPSATSTTFTTIPEGFFDGCLSLENFNYKNEITIISDYSFRSCVKLLYYIPNNVIHVGNYAFMNCRHIENVPKSVGYIGNMSFYGCSIRRYFYVPRSVTYIGFSAFSSVYVAMYCGNNDLSQSFDGFGPDTAIRVTYSYPTNMFCQHKVIRYSSCDSIKKTDVDLHNHSWHLVIVVSLYVMITI